MEKKCLISVVGSTQFTVGKKPVSNGNLMQVSTRTVLGDVTSLLKNAQNPRDLPVLSSNRWIKRLTPNVLMPVTEVHNKMVRAQSNGTHTSTSKIPIPVYRRRAPVPNHPQPSSSSGSSQTRSCDEIIELIDEFPLKWNKFELIWACTPLNSSVKKSFLIKNILNQPLQFKIDVEGNDFHVAVNVMDLKANECRSFEVTFCPNVIGKALGKLTFTPLLDWRYTAEKERTFSLCAYGGVAICKIRTLPGVHRVSDVNVLLNIEEIEDVTNKLITCKGSLHICNPSSVSGSLVVFAKPQDDNSSAIHETQIYIEPRKFVCHPNEEKAVTIACTLQFKEFERFRNQSSPMITISKIMIISGSEPDRQRIVSILLKCNDPSKRRKHSFVINGFPEVNADEFADYRGRLDHFDDLWSGFTVAEIPLVISQTKLNETLNSTIYDTCMDIENQLTN